MSKHRLTNMLCWFLTAVMLVLTVGFMNGEAWGLSAADRSGEAAYAGLFDDTVMHTIDIVADDSAWDDMLDNAQAEEYIACSVIIDGTAVKNAAVRAKGNTSLSMVSTDRYSLKIEFDHYEAGNSYMGLDKLVINNLIQDDTYLKDWLSYTLMREMGVASPLTSFAVVTVNGEYYGLCLALEAVEDSFLQRNYGGTQGDLYKPDSAMGGDGSADLRYTGDAVSDYSDIFESAKTIVTSEEQQELIAALKALNEGDLGGIDTEALIRYFVVHNFVVNGDSYTGSMVHNYYLYQEDGVLSMLPWDYNLAFGTFSMGGMGRGSGASSLVNWPLDEPLLSGSLSSRPMMAWIFESEEYTAQYHAVMDEFLQTCFESGWFEERMSAMMELLAPYVQADTTSFTDYDSFVEAAATLKEFCSLRAESLRGQLEGTIPSTSAGQSADPAALVDAGDLSVDVMGGMNMGGMMNMGGGRGTDEVSSDRTSNTAPPSGGSSGEDKENSEEDTAGERPSGWGENGQQFGGFPGGQMPGGEESSGNSGMPDGMSFPEGMEMPEGMNFPNGMEMPEGMTMPEGMEMPEGMDISNMMNFPGNMGDMDWSQMGGGRGSWGGSGGSSANGLILTGVSAAVLLFGILFAWKYKRR